jgi:hypothetical protein
MYNTKSTEGARVTRLLDSLDVWIMPMNNPDGTYPVSDNNALNSRRENKNGKDLNRNFPEQYTDPVNTTTGRQPETVAMMNFVSGKTFTLSANFHAGAVLVNYPWDSYPDGSDGYLTNNCPDSTWFIELSTVYASHNADMASSKEFTGGITNGSLWYAIYGGRQDWMYSFNNCRETTIELSEPGLPDSAELVRQWSINKESFMLYFEQALLGFQGSVRDDQGTPLAGKIKLLEIPDNFVLADSATGYYARLTHAGIYNIVCSKEGYISDTLRNVELSSGARYFHDFVLVKEHNAVTEMASGNEVSANYSDGKITLFGAGDGTAEVSLYSAIGARVFNSNVSTSSDNCLLLNTGLLSSGAYFGEVIRGDKKFRFRIVIYS